MQIAPRQPPVNAVELQPKGCGWMRLREIWRAAGFLLLAGGALGRAQDRDIPKHGPAAAPFDGKDLSQFDTSYSR